jgi:hypothetical protein
VACSLATIIPIALLENSDHWYCLVTFRTFTWKGGGWCSAQLSSFWASCVSSSSPGWRVVVCSSSRITNECMEVQTDTQWSSPFSWPKTQCPDYIHRVLWRSALAKVFMRSTDPQALRQPLGQFSEFTAQTWVWKYSPSEQRLFLPVGDRRDFFQVRSGRRRSVNRQYHRGGSTLELPLDNKPATVSKNGLNVQLLLIGSPSSLAVPVSDLTFSQTLDQLPASALWKIKEYSSPSDLSSILIAALTNGIARAISDGSSIDKFGISAFTIVDDHINSIIG